MNARRIFKPFHSIRARLLVLLLGSTILTVLVLAAIAVTTTQSQGQSAQQISSQALRTQAEAYLLQLTVSGARENDLLLERVLLDVTKLAGFTANVFDHAEAFSNSVFWNVDEHVFQAEAGQWMNSKEDVSSAFLPNSTAYLDESIRRDLELSAHLDLVFPPIFENNPGTEAIYFASQRSLTRYYPNIGLGELVPPDFDATQRVWYTGSTLAENPQRKAWWTPVYVDATGLGLVMTAAAPVYKSNNEMIGVVGLDITLTDLVANVTESRVLQSGYFFLIDKTGHTIALPQQGFLDILNRAPQENEINTDISGLKNAFGPVIEKMMAGESGFQSLTSGNKELFVAYAPLASSDWSMGSVVEASEVLAAVDQLSGELEQTTRSLIISRILLFSAIVIGLVIIVALLFTNILVRPINQLSEAAVKIKDGQWDTAIPTPDTTEMNVLADAFRTMTLQLRQMVEGLETRVAERTQALERRNIQLQVASEVARDASSSRQLDVLLTRAVNLIRDRFGFYHAGIFLLDENGEYAVLEAATGEAGKAMLDRAHKLEVGAVGIVGFAAGSGSPRISLNVGSDAEHFKNPLLPETRSEMALPLKLGNKVTGVLDVQSRDESAFKEEDIAVLQTMADQLAVAIENARLFQESRASLEQLKVLYRKIDKDAWLRVGQARNFTGFRFENGGVTPLQADKSGNGPNGQLEEKAPVSMPLVVRGEEIGALEVWPTNEGWSSEESAWLQSVGDRISQAMESARLFEEAQSRAAREQTLNMLVAGFARSLDFETLLQNAAQELGSLANVAEVSIMIGPSANEPENGTKTVE